MSTTIRTHSEKMRLFKQCAELSRILMDANDRTGLAHLARGAWLLHDYDLMADALARWEARSAAWRTQIEAAAGIFKQRMFAVYSAQQTHTLAHLHFPRWDAPDVDAEGNALVIPDDAETPADVIRKERGGLTPLERKRLQRMMRTRKHENEEGKP